MKPSAARVGQGVAFGFIQPGVIRFHRGHRGSRHRRDGTPGRSQRAWSGKSERS